MKEYISYSVKFSLWIDDILVDKEIDMHNPEEVDKIVSYATNELILKEEDIKKYLTSEVIEKNKNTKTGRSSKMISKKL